MYVHIHVTQCTHLHTINTHTHMHTHTYTQHTHAHTHMHTHMHTHTPSWWLNKSKVGMAEPLWISDHPPRWNRSPQHSQAACFHPAHLPNKCTVLYECVGALNERVGSRETILLMRTVESRDWTANRVHVNHPPCSFGWISVMRKPKLGVDFVTFLGPQVATWRCAVFPSEKESKKWRAVLRATYPGDLGCPLLLLCRLLPDGRKSSLFVYLYLGRHALKKEY